MGKTLFSEAVLDKKFFLAPLGVFTQLHFLKAKFGHLLIARVMFRLSGSKFNLPNTQKLRKTSSRLVKTG